MISNVLELIALFGLSTIFFFLCKQDVDIPWFPKHYNTEFNFVRLIISTARALVSHLFGDITLPCPKRMVNRRGHLSHLQVISQVDSRR